jgi:predicted phage-related endonuclease
LGASDAAALVGVDPWRTAGDVWAEKTGRVLLEDEEPADEMTATALGKAIGPLLVQIAAEKLHRPVAPEVWYRHPVGPLACSVDGIVLDPPAVLIEAKTSGLLGPMHLQHATTWGDDGSDEVPESVVIQVHHALAVLDAQPNVPVIRQILIPALIGGRGFRCYRIERNDALVDQLFEMETDWWHQYVDGDRCPPDDPPSMSTLRRQLRQADAPPRTVDNTYVVEWRAAKDVLKQAEKTEEFCRRLVIADLGDGEIGECAAGRLTYRAVHRAAYMVPQGVVRTLRFTPHRERQVA